MSKCIQEGKVRVFFNLHIAFRIGKCCKKHRILASCWSSPSCIVKLQKLASCLAAKTDNIQIPTQKYWGWILNALQKVIFISLQELEMHYIRFA